MLKKLLALLIKNYFVENFYKVFFSLIHYPCPSWIDKFGYCLDYCFLSILKNPE